MRIIKNLFICLLVFIVSIQNVFAQDVVCEYPEFEITLTYQDGVGEPNINYSNWDQNEDVRRFFNIYRYANSVSAYEEIEIDPALYLAQGATCPTEMYICEYTDLSLEWPGIGSLGIDLIGEITDLIEGLIDLFSNPPSGLTEFSQMLDENGWALVGQELRLYLLNYESYRNHEYREYEGGKTSSELADHYMDGYNTGSNIPIFGYVPVLSEISGFVFGSVNDIGWTLQGTILGFGDSELSLFYHREFNCKRIQYQGDNATIDVNCNSVITELYNYDTAINNYKNCSTEDCKSAKIKDLNNVEKRLKAHCKSVLSNYTYNELQKDCIETCNSLGKTLNDKKIGTDLYREPDKNHSGCTLSSRLVDWILKLINWLRYIVPVLLIILSILDFIKAIAADSEEELKKVTSKFTKRLIVAVLIFILPLALEFLLGIFGIDTHSFCL